MGVGGFFTRDATNEEQWLHLLRMGLDLGMNFIDSAEVYGAGHSEELLGRAIQGQRQRAFIATKFSPEHSSFDQVQRAVEGSLNRLQTDYLDLLQTHWRNYQVPLEETARAMRQLVEQGKVRYLGVSNFTVRETRELQMYLGDIELVSSQQEYNVVDRSIEGEILPFCQSAGLTVIAYSPLLQGKITGKTANQEVLSGLAQKYQASAAQLILKWLTQAGNVIAIPKAGSEKHLMENAAAAEIELDRQDLQVLDQIFYSPVEFLATDRIQVAEDAHRNVYRTVEEALENHLRLNPSPEEMAQEILKGEFLKPIKVKNAPTDSSRYLLVEGRVKYWGWVIAFGSQKAIPALVV